MSAFGEFVSAADHRGTNWTIALAALAASAISPGWLNISVPSLASSIFQVAGTMVALALPAAQLAGSMVSQTERELLKLLEPLSAEISSKQRRLHTLDVLTGKLQRSMYPAMRSGAFALISLVLASIASIIGSAYVRISSDGLSLSVDRAIVVASLGYLLAAALWIYPTVRYAFGLKYLDDIRETYKVLIETETDLVSGSPSTPIGRQAVL